MTEEEFKDLVENGIIHNEKIANEVNDIIKGQKILNFMNLATYRISVPYKKGKLSLDRCEYVNTVDYELEYEVSNRNTGKLEFVQIKEKFGLLVMYTNYNIPQVERVKDKGYDILYLTEYVDEFCVTAIQEYDSKKFKNVSDEGLDLESDEEKEATKKANEDNSDLLKDMCDKLDEVTEVRFSNKLKTHPVCLTTKGDVSLEMQKVFDAMPNDMGVKAQTVLEINEKHPISEKLKKLYKKDKDEFDKYTKILYSEARMIAGLPIDNPTEISKLICEVISK